MLDRGPARQVLRLCLDLNGWVGDLLSRRSRTSGGLSAAQRLVQAVRDGRDGNTPVQLVVSVGMLDRLDAVLARLGTTPDVAMMMRDSIARLAALGPRSRLPDLVLGGTGVLPLRDAEDRHVLEVAIAARAHALATSNLADLLTCEILVTDRVAIHRSPDWEVLIARPQEIAAWMSRGVFPEPATVRRLLTNSQA